MARWRLVTAAVTFTVGVGLLGAARVSQYRVSIDEAHARVRQLANALAAAHEGLIANDRRDLAAMAGEPPSDDDSWCSRLSAEAAARPGRYLELGAKRVGGEPVCSTRSPVLPSDLPLAAAEPSATSDTRPTYALDPVTRRGAVTVYYLVVDAEGAIRLVLFAVSDLADVYRFASTAALPEKTRLAIVNSNGSILSAYGAAPPRGVPTPSVTPGSSARVVDTAEVGGVAFFFAFTLVTREPGGDVYAVVGIPSDVSVWDTRSLGVLDVLGGVLVLGAGVIGVGALIRPRAADRRRTRRRRSSGSFVVAPSAPAREPSRLPPSAPAVPPAAAPALATPVPEPTPPGRAGPPPTAPGQSAFLPDRVADAGTGARPTAAPASESASLPPPMPPAHNATLSVELPPAAPLAPAAVLHRPEVEPPPVVRPPAPAPAPAVSAAPPPAAGGSPRPAVSVDAVSAYWRLSRPAFDNSPNPSFLYASPDHEEGLMRMLYAVRSRKGAAMLTAEPGCGKTTLARALVQQLPAQQYAVALITHPTGDAVSLLKEILFNLGIRVERDDKATLLRVLHEELHVNAQKGRDTVIIVDEAQLIDEAAALEELRLLLNFQTSERFLVTLTLFGTPELAQNVLKLKHVHQRIAIRYYVRPLDAQHTAAYIAHRLKAAGRTEPIFTERAVARVFELSGGTPRVINSICDLALFVGGSRALHRIDVDVVEAIGEDFAAHA